MKSEYEKFDLVMRELIKVPHNELKDKLDKEKATKKRRKLKTSSAFRASGEVG